MKTNKNCKVRAKYIGPTDGLSDDLKEYRGICKQSARHGDHNWADVSGISADGATFSYCESTSKTILPHMKVGQYYVFMASFKSSVLTSLRPFKESEFVDQTTKKMAAVKEKK